MDIVDSTDTSVSLSVGDVCDCSDVASVQPTISIANRSFYSSFDMILEVSCMMSSEQNLA